MPVRAKRVVTLLALIAALAWFMGLRERTGELVAAGRALLPAYRGPVDAPDELTGSQAQPYSLEDLHTQFGNSGVRPENADDPAPAVAQVGETAEFWVMDETLGQPHQVTATLEAAGEHVLMYVDQTVAIDRQALAQAARDFDQRIYPNTLALFGPDVSAEQPGDPRLVILHTPLASAGGYFSSADIEPLAVNPFSNRRKMFVIGADSYLPGEEGYLKILAHELQHMLHAAVQPDSPAWFNEGLSMLSQDLNGYVEDELARIYLADPELGLTDWSKDASISGEHYGAAQLFFRYFYEQYGGASALRELVRAGAGSRPQVFAGLAAQTRPDIAHFIDLVADWAVANLVNDASLADGRYAYAGLPDFIAPQQMHGSRMYASVDQLGVDCLGVIDGPRRLVFDGEDAVALTGARPKQGDWMWWSGRGDGRVATLTRAFDLRSVNKATLHFFAWYELERDFDYAYVTVSTDGGQTWQSLSGQHTHRDDPQGSNLGNGLTGVSGRPDVDPEEGQRGRWVQERMDLSPFSGKQLLVRFWVVNDPAYNAQGLLLDEIRIPEIGYREGGETGESGWQTQGFARTRGGIPQEWALRLVVETGAGIEVHPVALDEHSRTEMALASNERAVLVVIGNSPLTDEAAHYQVVSQEP